MEYNQLPPPMQASTHQQVAPYQHSQYAPNPSNGSPNQYQYPPINPQYVPNAASATPTINQMHAATHLVESAAQRCQDIMDGMTATINSLKEQVAEANNRVTNTFYSTVVNPKGIKVYGDIDDENTTQYIPCGYTLMVMGPHFSINGDARLWMRAVFDKVGDDQILAVSQRYVCLADDSNKVSNETRHITMPSIVPRRFAVFANRLNVKYKPIVDDEEDELDDATSASSSRDEEAAVSQSGCCWAFMRWLNNANAKSHVSGKKQKQS